MVLYLSVKVKLLQVWLLEVDAWRPTKDIPFFKAIGSGE